MLAGALAALLQDVALQELAALSMFLRHAKLQEAMSTGALAAFLQDVAVQEFAAQAAFLKRAKLQEAMLAGPPKSEQLEESTRASMAPAPPA